MIPSAWQARFLQQSRWTEEVRRYLYQQIGLERAVRILEVGCGPGVILADLEPSTRAAVHGLDIRLDFLRLGQSLVPDARLTCGDGLALPYADGSFDITLCHFLLLWLDDPLRALAEMHRVTRENGYVVALAEPDYTARIDYPEELSELGKLQAAALASQGANPGLGRRLPALFQAAGLRRVRVGLLGGQWGQPLEPEFMQSEWTVIEHDLQARLPKEELARLRRIDEAAWKQGIRILFVPTFYAWGKV